MEKCLNGSLNMKLICRLFGHKWKRVVDNTSKSTLQWRCKRCGSLKIIKQFVGTAMLTEFDENMNIVREEVKVTRGAR